MKLPDAAGEEGLYRALRTGERSLPLPATLHLHGHEGIQVLRVVRSLRLLPGKRVTLEGWLKDPAGGLETRVALKLFCRRRGGDRHHRREREGWQRVTSAGLACPALLGEGRADAGRLTAVVYGWVEGGVSLAALWPSLDGEGRRRWLERVQAALARLHDHGSRQRDLHLGNFLVRGEELVVLDLATVGRCLGVPGPRQRLAELGRLAAQLSVAEQLHGLEWMAATVVSQGSPRQRQNQLWRSLRRAWRRRLADYLAKSRRPCSLTHVERSWHRHWYCRRQHWQPDLQQLAVDPELFMARGRLLKAGNTATVVATELDGRQVIIKRYNIKNWRHGLSRALRPTRGTRSWLSAHLLELAGIAATRPVALLEQRWGPVRRQAYLVCDAIEGQELLELGSRRPLDHQELAGLEQLLRLMQTCRISHGDFKASNLLVRSGQPWLIDLDALTRHSSRRGAARGLARDLDRLIRNWPAEQTIHAQLVELLTRLPPRPRQL